MVKALSFKGDKKPPKKRKRTQQDDNNTNSENPPSSSKQLHQTLPSTLPEEDDDENWVSAETIQDISGPILIILPTNNNPISCAAVDSLGKVFVSKIENLVENAPSTAEPHDVRQVWIAQRIVGMENSFTFKGFHGRYLGCDQYGYLSSTREAVSPEETFTCTPSATEAGKFDIQTLRDKFLGVNDNDGDENEKSATELRGDAESPGELTAMRIRMQARFKPKHQVDKAEKVRAKISRKELEDEVGRRLEDDEVKKLKKARREGNFHEVMLDVKVKGKHDKFA